MRKRLFTAICCLTITSAACAAPITHTSSSVNILKATADAQQPAGSPILVNLILENHETKPLHYWCGGPGRFPSADHISATLTDGKGATRKIDSDITFGASHGGPVLANGQYTMGSGIDYDINPGDNITIPIAISPLPPGVYTFSFQTTFQAGAGFETQISTATQTPLHVEVKQDIALMAARNRMLQENAQNREAFASFVISKYGNLVAITSLLHDLASPDIARVRAAWQTVRFASKMPSEADAIIADDLRKVTPQYTDPDHERLSYLMEIAQHYGSKNTLTALQRIIAQFPNSWAKERAAETLKSMQNSEHATVLQK